MPSDLDALHERFVTEAAMLLGLEAVEKTGTRSWYFELGGKDEELKQTYLTIKGFLEGNGGK